MKNPISVLLTILFVFSRYPALSTETMTIFGLNEKVLILPENLLFNAKLDTGADMTSMDAQQMLEYQRNGQTWIKFLITQRHGNEIRNISMERPLKKYIYIRQHNEVGIKRPVVDLILCLGRESHQVEVNLADRSRFNFPVLIGVNAISAFSGMVNPNEKYLESPACE